MPDFGQCSEPSCTGLFVRLFDCTHHCMKSVCLQHLIEHDQSIDHNQENVDDCRTELKQLWTTYSLLVDETKLRSEFEQKLNKHQQLIRDITNLSEHNSGNIEQYRFMLEKLKQNIEQEKQVNQYSSESLSHIEQIKIEPCDDISTINESDSLDVSLATRIGRLNNDIRQQKRKSTAHDSITIDDCNDQICNTSQTSDNATVNKRTNNYPPNHELFGKCPLWFDGAFGLTKKFHGLQLCTHNKYYHQLYRHLIRYHKLTISNVKLICQAIRNKEDSRMKILFKSNDIVMDEVNQFRCPFSIHNKVSSRISNPSQHRCRGVKPQLGYVLRYHLIRFHNMNISNADKLINKLKKENN